MNSNLENWISENKILASESEELSDVIVIEGIGKFLHVQHKENKIIDEEFAFILYDEELDMIEDKVVDYVLFEFGGRFYYSKINVDKNKYGEEIYKPDFIDFKYLGTTADETIIEFVNLGVHDEYEMLNGTSSPELWCKKAKFLRHKSLGICNKNTLASVLSFQTFCQKYEIKPIIGETVTVAVNYDGTNNLQETFELKLYVLNDKGWENLLKINKAINVEYSKFIPNFVLEEFGEGLCCVIPKNSEFNYHIEDIAFCKKLLKKLKRVFDCVYYQIDTVEYLSNTLFKEHLSKIDAYIVNFASILEPILINDSYYLDKQDYIVKSLLNKVSGRAEAESHNQYYKDFEQTVESYKEWEDVEQLYECIIWGIQNTESLSEGIDFKIQTGERKLPNYEVNDVESLFFEQVELGISKRLSDLDDEQLSEYMKQLEIEFDLIVPNGLCDYFMILWDITNWCRTNKILVGPGRGSVCGSLVAFLLGITDVDPLKYGLMFERFLNAARITAPEVYVLELEDGSKLNLPTSKKIPLMNGDEIDVDSDFIDEDIDIVKLKSICIKE